MTNKIKALDSNGNLFHAVEVDGALCDYELMLVTGEYRPVPGAVRAEGIDMVQYQKDKMRDFNRLGQ